MYNFIEAGHCWWKRKVENWWSATSFHITTSFNLTTSFNYNLHFLFSAQCQLIRTVYKIRIYGNVLLLCLRPRTPFLHYFNKYSQIFLAPQVGSLISTALSPPTHVLSLSYTKQDIKHLRFVVVVLGFHYKDSNFCHKNKTVNLGHKPELRFCIFFLFFFLICLMLLLWPHALVLMFLFLFVELEHGYGNSWSWHMLSVNLLVFGRR